jgi:hypothetical protein
MNSGRDRNRAFGEIQRFFILEKGIDYSQLTPGMFLDWFGS